MRQKFGTHIPSVGKRKKKYVAKTKFTDPEAALEEAEYLAELYDVSFCIVEVEPNCILVVPKKELNTYSGTVLETVNPVREFNIDD